MKKTVAVFVLSASCAFALYAGSTGTTSLLTPQGSGAATTNGDFVSSAGAGALNSVYHYWIEVPPGLNNLVVDIFDADIGLGGAAEAAAGRDRSRTGFNTAVNYTLFNPNGAQRNTLFTTGDAANPVGADNAWLNFYTSTGDTVRDNFTTVAYTNNNGTMNWATNWIETNDDANAAAGLIQITGGQLRIRDDGNANPSTIEREANLTGFATATFSFDFNTANVAATDQMRVQVSSNGGTSWTTLETFTGAFAVGSTRSYDISAFIAANTRIRFIEVGGYTGTDSFFVDNLQIKNSAITPGHWEVRLDMSSAVTAGDAINAFGLRAHDGTPGAGGTELNLYADSMLPAGVNPPGAGTASRNYTFFPYITSGCTCQHNDFDYDSNSGTVGSFTYTSPSGVFAQSLASATLSTDNTWNRDAIAGYVTDASAVDYGIWNMAQTITSYLVGGTPNGNYTVIYDANFQAAANPPAANPPANSFRIYFPTDAGVAPLKPHLQQQLTQRGGGALAVGVPQRYTVSILVDNPTANAITFSAAHLVTANIPGGGAVYNGGPQVSQGSIVSQPAVGGTGNITWNPGTVAAGGSALLSYDVLVTAASAGQRIPVTATPASGNGTRAQYVDETGNTTQARATYLFGPICELAVTQGLITEVLLSSFDVSSYGGGTLVAWKTASESGTIGFNLYRVDASGELTRANDRLLPANAGAPQGGKYRFVDTHNHDAQPVYVLEEITASGKKLRYGPFAANNVAGSDPAPSNDYDHEKNGHKGNNNGNNGNNGNNNDDQGDDNGNNDVSKFVIMAGVRETGVVRLLASDIAAKFSAPGAMVEAGIRSGRISVTYRGQQVAWTPSADGKAILFFGESSESIYSRDRVYRLALDHGTAMNTVNAAPATPSATAFTATRDYEQDAFPALVLPMDAEGDYWFWDYVVSGDPLDGHKTFTLQVPSLASADGAVLQVRLQGALADTSHRAQVAVNGVPIGETAWSGLDGRVAELNVPAAVLREGANSVDVTGVLDPGAAFDVFYIDGFQLRYSRGGQPEAGRLEMTANGAPVTAGPFNGETMVLDITDRKRPAILRGASASGGNLSLTPPSSARTLFFSDSTAFVAPSFIRRAQELGLADQNHRADYLIVAPSALTTSVKNLAQLRTREGLQTFTAALEPIYDEFNYGNPTPHAIRAFIAATQRWQRAPRYVVLAGGGSLDYRGLTVDPGLVPPLMITTSEGIFASDSRFADLNGDGLPDIAIGRIPVFSNDEMNAYLRKLDANLLVTSTTAPIVLAADATDGGADFKRASALVEPPFGGRPAAHLYIDEIGGAAARSGLLTTWRSGTPLVSWFGHGGLDRISSQSILTVDDAPALTSTGQLPLLVAMTCTINRFELGDAESLGSALTRAPNAGALGVWSASGLSVHSAATELSRTFMRLAASSRNARIGDLIVKAYSANLMIGETGKVYLLLGDPAARLVLPVETQPVGTPSNRRE